MDRKKSCPSPAGGRARADEVGDLATAGEDRGVRHVVPPGNDGFAVRVRDLSSTSSRSRPSRTCAVNRLGSGSSRCQMRPKSVVFSHPTSTTSAAEGKQPAKK